MKSNGGCSQFCASTNGSVTCYCLDGYKLATDGKQCSRSDPCDFANGGCSHICNSDGNSVVCSCKEGFRLDADGKSCSGRIQFATSHSSKHISRGAMILVLKFQYFHQTSGILWYLPELPTFSRIYWPSPTISGNFFECYQ